MRARSLKPAFFTDEHVVALPFEGRLLFAGLWCAADRAGRLEDRPKQLKINLFPCDDVDVDRLLDGLVQVGLIIRYTVDEVRYIAVKNFEKHQNPHVREPESIIPAPDEHSTSTVPALLTPDSGLLTPKEESTNVLLSDESPDPPAKAPSIASVARARFEHWRATFPNETAKMSFTKDRERAVTARLREGIAPEVIDEAVTNARGDPFWNGAKDGEWKADIKTICGKGSTVERLAARSKQQRSGMDMLRQRYGGAT
jgi:hypothetical protein